ncbi:MAG: hypothetical protein Q7S60_05935 [bacterium]|nr:hypothetical protein [bacterium]
MEEIIPRPTQKAPAWQNALLYLSLALLLAAVISFFLLGRFIKNADISLKNLEETLTKEKTSQEIDLEKSIIFWQIKIRDFSQLLERHVYPSNFFDFISKIAHPKTWFQQVALDLKESKVAIQGSTESFTTLGQQLFILEQEPSIKDFTLSSLLIGKKGKVDFSLNITLDPNLFKGAQR